MKTQLIHVGMPKSLSTSLQRSFFAKHKEVEFLGNTSEGAHLGWQSQEISILFEVFLRYQSNLDFDNGYAKKIISEHLNSFKPVKLSFINGFLTPQ